MIGATSAEAETAEAASVATRRPRLLVFQLDDIFTLGIAIVGSARAAESCVVFWSGMIAPARQVSVVEIPKLYGTLEEQETQ